MSEPVSLVLAHSPDADDMAMWWPITGMRGPDGQPIDDARGSPALDTGRWLFEPLPEDVQRLNRRSMDAGDLDITAISAHTYAHVRDRYAITACGGSFGEGYGPKVVVAAGSKHQFLGELFQSTNVRLLVPGLHTTAYLSLCVLLERKVDAQERLFSEIPAAVAAGEFDAGLLIHEAQLSFRELGLRPLGDLGALWQQRFGSVLPLGLNVIRRDLDTRFGAGSVQEVSAILQRSVACAMERREDTKAFLRMHAERRPEWLDSVLVDQYLDMYVSAMTLDMGEVGAAALASLLGEGYRMGLCPDPGEIDIY